MSADQSTLDDRHRDTKPYDVVVVGGGGWGLAVLKVLTDMGLHVLGVERKELCHNLRRYMKHMVMHSVLSYMVLDPDDAILAQKGDEHHPLIEELIQSYSDFAAKFNLPIKTHHELVDVKGTKGDFVLTVRSRDGQLDRLAAKRVVLATGSFDEAQSGRHSRRAERRRAALFP